MPRTSISGLSAVRKEHKDKKIVFCSGCFDLLHAGHILFFEKCRQYGDVLVVMIGGDKVISHNKGSDRPIFNERARIKVIQALSVVSYCFIDKIVPKKPSDLLVAVEQALLLLKPDIYIVNDDAFDLPQRERMAYKYGVRLIVLPRRAYPRFRDFSATATIEKIKNL